jgi:hypothetical protein
MILLLASKKVADFDDIPASYWYLRGIIRSMQSNTVLYKKITPHSLLLVFDDSRRDRGYRAQEALLYGY